MSEPIATTSAEEVARPGTARWWDPLVVLIIALLGWLILLSASALAVVLSLRAMGRGLQVLGFIAVSPKNFFVLQAYMAAFYVAVLLVMQFLA